ncbi:MAG: J domain-containing protein [Polyangiaceae bacterium]
MRLSRELLDTDLYALLGVAPDAGWHEIRRAYRRSVRESHPDFHPGDPLAVGRTARLNAAARVLLDPGERRVYDRARADRERPRSSWYERVSVGGSEWERPSPQAYSASAAAEHAGEFRERKERTALYLQDWFFGMSNERRLKLAALCLALGWGLISFAHPSNAFWLPPAGAQASAP